MVVTVVREGWSVGVRVLVPIKPLDRAKTRLRCETDDDPVRHAALVTAMSLDTVLAAAATDEVRAVTVVSSDARVTAAFAEVGVEVLADEPEDGLNAALRHGEAVLRHRHPRARFAALQADLPALRPAELGAALRAALDDRAVCADQHGTGTTLLVAAPGAGLDPRFGAGSALHHRDSRARPLTGTWPSLRCDVDTVSDLVRARELGVGPRTLAALATSTTAPGFPHPTEPSHDVP